MIESADVVWGHPSGHTEADLLSAPVELSTQHLDEIATGLPELFTALEAALRRGQPAAM